MNINIFRPIQLGKETFLAKSYDENEFVMDWTVESGGKVPSHVHHHMDEHFKVLKGEVTFQSKGQTVTKKSGEEYFVKKGTIHSVTNALNGQSVVTVTYKPCADTHRMFHIIAALDEEKPGSMVNMIKYFYLAPRLGLKEFSTVSPAFLMRIMNGIVTGIGFLSGWKVLIEKFKE